MRCKTELFKRYIFLFVGLLVNAFGVVLITKSCLGTSPIASVPYVLSEYYPITMGMFNFLFYLLMFLIQLLLLRKKFAAKDWLQIPLSILFSLFMDLCLAAVSDFTPQSYGIMLGTFLFGCLFRALGVSMQVTADVAMLSGEAFIIAIAKVSKKDFSLIKLISDAVFVVMAAVLSFLLLGRIEGIREGTLLAVIIIAPLTKVCSKRLGCFEERFLEPTAKQSPVTMQKYVAGVPFIVTMSSESGSGGHRIAKILSEKLGLPLYDNNLIEMIAKEGKFTSEYVRKHMERLYTNRFWEFFVENYNYTGYSLESYEPLFLSQKKVIEDISEKGSCIIVGYCSEYLLRERENVFRIHIHADEQTKLAFLKQEYHVDSKEAAEIMRSHDKERALYFKHFTGEEWSKTNRFQISVDSSMLGMEGTANLLCDIINRVKS